jgi:hypothetical protein
MRTSNLLIIVSTLASSSISAPIPYPSPGLPGEFDRTPDRIPDTPSAPSSKDEVPDNHPTRSTMEDSSNKPPEPVKMEKHTWITWVEKNMPNIMGMFGSAVSIAATPGAVNPAAASLGVTSFLNIVGNTMQRRRRRNWRLRIKRLWE